ncbi:MAG: hypothetical protein J6A04_07635 [Clostridia bacterium]|nr:hypothetical protein [Clostridia bacterium]
MEGKYEEAKEKLKKYKQEHLLIWYDKLIEQKREELINQILKIDFEQIDELYKQTQQKKDFKDCKIEPLPYIDKQKLTAEEKQKYETDGISIIKEGKYAVVTMAGGQGTRLRT